jgi:transposase
MANKRLLMRQIREVLRLKYGSGLNLGQREIGQACGMGRTAVSDCLARARQAGLSWPLPESLSDAELEARLYPEPVPEAAERAALPDFQYIHDELRHHRRVNLTLDLLWREYREQRADGYSYAQFCKLYARWRSKQDYVMRQVHRAGEKLFVDYTDGPAIIDPKSGERVPTQLFVGVWGCSNLTYVEASLSQKVPAWVNAHVRAFNYFGCAPHVLVPDNLKSAVLKPCYYDPELNRSYAELAAHYGVAVLPARVRKPRDKAKVEGGALIAQRWILAVLRHRTFFSLAELNAAILELLERLNARLLRKAGKSRRELFEAMDRPAARALPERPYQYAEWIAARVNIDYHVQADQHRYSVPFRLLHEKLDIRLTATTMEAFFKHERIAAHPRSYVANGCTTLKDHMPPAHQKHLEWPPSRIVDWARRTGPATAGVVEKIMAGRMHPEQGYRACLGVIKLGQSYGDPRLEAASRRALRFNACSFQSLRKILDQGLDRLAEGQEPIAQPPLPLHDNVRGGGYYH